MLSLTYILVIRTKPLWIMISSSFLNFIFHLTIAVLFIWMITKIVIEIYRFIRGRNKLTYGLLSILIINTSIYDSFKNTLNVNLEDILEDVVFEACYEGTMNQAKLKLRKNKKFDLHWTGVFFYNEYFSGEYVKINDTILLQFENQVPRMLDDTLIVSNQHIYRLKSDSVFNTLFYTGRCKGLN